MIYVAGRPMLWPADGGEPMMTEPGGRRDPGLAGGDDLRRLASSWTVGLDTLARAAAAAVTAPAEAQLCSATADAFIGRFADWAFVDFLSGPPGRRAVSTWLPDPALAAALSGVTAESCPVIRSAVHRCTPEVRPGIDDEWMLGTLPDGRAVARAIRARSVAVGPIVSGSGACGAITVVRCRTGSRLGFRELGVLSQVGKLAGAAVERLRRG